MAMCNEAGADMSEIIERCEVKLARAIPYEVLNAFTKIKPVINKGRCCGVIDETWMSLEFCLEPNGFAVEGELIGEGPNYDPESFDRGEPEQTQHAEELQGHVYASFPNENCEVNDVHDHQVYGENSHHIHFKCEKVDRKELSEFAIDIKNLAAEEERALQEGRYKTGGLR